MPLLFYILLRTISGVILFYQKYRGTLYVGLFSQKANALFQWIVISAHGYFNIDTRLKNNNVWNSYRKHLNC